MAGGKTKLLPELLTHVPANYGTYFEPFVGGGALFFALRACDDARGDRRKYVLGDMNQDLITAYRQIREQPSELIRRLKGMKNTASLFARVRAYDIDVLPDGTPGKDSARAARFIFLNKTCFNGLHRVNRAGKFNVPFGRYPNPKICDEPNLRAVSRALKSVKTYWAPFAETVKSAVAGDLVYFDSPYFPLTGKGSFTAYGHSGFGYADHVALRDCALQLKKKGVTVLLSNSDTPEVHALYGGHEFKIARVQAARSINASGEGRAKISELLIR